MYFTNELLHEKMEYTFNIKKSSPISAKIFLVVIFNTVKPVPMPVKRPFMLTTVTFISDINISIAKKQRTEIEKIGEKNLGPFYQDKRNT